MATITVLTISDGRPSVHETIRSFALGVQERIVNALEARGHLVTGGSEPIWTNEGAVNMARAAAAERPDLVILNLPVWAFPHFSVLVAKEISAPLVLFGNVDPQYPGMVAMLAAGGALDQLGCTHGRVWGDVDDDAVLDRLVRHAAAGRAVRELQGSTFGRIGGRPMGMYTAVSSGDQWIDQFGVDVEEIDQLELVRRAELVEPGRARAGREWLERHTAGVHYDGRQLTPEVLERQIRTYHAMRAIIDDRRLDFAGIKAQPELTDHVCTMDLTEAFLNDPYDWEGAKPAFVCSTEADMDAALTMQILKCLSDTPVLFADVRHYDAGLDLWDLCNSGQHATWFARRSDDPAENLRHVHLYPQSFYFPAGGAAVHHVAGAGEMTFARLTRLDGRYRMHVLRGRFEALEDDVAERLMRSSSYEWPHAFARFDAGADDVLARYGSNHIHAVPGDHVAALKEVCRLLDVDFDPIGRVT